MEAVVCDGDDDATRIRHRRRHIVAHRLAQFDDFVFDCIERWTLGGRREVGVQNGGGVVRHVEGITAVRGDNHHASDGDALTAVVAVVAIAGVAVVVHHLRGRRAGSIEPLCGGREMGGGVVIRRDRGRRLHRRRVIAHTAAHRLGGALLRMVDVAIAVAGTLCVFEVLFADGVFARRRGGKRGNDPRLRRVGPGGLTGRVPRVLLNVQLTGVVNVHFLGSEVAVFDEVQPVAHVILQTFPMRLLFPSSFIGIENVRAHEALLLLDREALPRFRHEVVIQRDGAQIAEEDTDDGGVFRVETDDGDDHEDKHDDADVRTVDTQRTDELPLHPRVLSRKHAVGGKDANVREGSTQHTQLKIWWRMVVVVRVVANPADDQNRHLHRADRQQRS